MVRFRPRPRAANDLTSAERDFMSAAREMGFGWFESVQVRRGELVLSPFPAAVQMLKFGTVSDDTAEPAPNFNLKKQAQEFFEFVRGVEDGIIRRLEIRHGLPFAWRLIFASREGCRMLEGSMLKLFEKNGRGRSSQAAALPGQFHS